MKPDEQMPTSTALIISAAFAIVFLVLFMWVGGFGFFGALLLGLLIGIVVFVILIMLFTGTETSTGAGASAPGAAEARATPKPATGGASGSKPQPGAAEKKPKPKPKAKPAAGASAAATARTGGAKDATKPGAGAAKAAEAPAPKPAAKGAASVEAQPGGKAPGALQGPREGGADNLKEIKGVGPKLEKMLHDMGVYHFDQIAAWGRSEIAWADENLKGFKGRVSRDDWVGQAKILAEGGETEFSKKVDKGDVY